MTYIALGVSCFALGIALCNLAWVIIQHAH